MSETSLKKTKEKTKQKKTQKIGIFREAGLTNFRALISQKQETFI